MSLSAAERFFSLLALLAGAGAIGLVVLRLVPGGRPTLAMLAPAGRWLAFLVTGTATAGSLYFSEIQEFTPCRLCWFQRIFMFSLAVITFVGAVRRDPGVRRYAIPLAGLGICVSIYHYLVEWYPQLETDSCAISVPCSVPWYREFGFVTLSFSAMCGFAAVLALMTVVPSDDASAPYSDPDDEDLDVDTTSTPATAAPGIDAPR